MNRTATKLLAVLLCVCMLVPSLQTVNVFADPTAVPTVTVSDATTVAGNTFTVDVIASGNPGINTFTFSIDYDRDNFILNSVTVNPALGGQSNFSKKVVWLSSQDLVFNGVLFTIELTAKGDTLDGEYAVSVSYNPGDICNHNEVDIDFEIIPGKITVLSVVAGDINGDYAVNNKDLVRFLRYLSGEEVYVNTPCLDPNGDGVVNNKDLNRLMKFIAGEDVEMYPRPVTCRHDLVAYPAVDPTCTENGNIAYWYCTKCLKYYSDAEAMHIINSEDAVLPALGHLWEAIPDVPPTYDTWGSTGGTRCSRCNTIGIEPTPVEPLQRNEFNIYYKLCYVEDIVNGVPRIVENNYLKQQFLADPDYIFNDNGNRYTEGIGIPLDDPTAAGYDFLGWYEYPEVNARRIYSISAEDTGDKTIYAVWTKHEYTLTYLPDSAASTLPRIPSETFYVDTETALQVPSWPNLVWVGWSDDDGNIIKSIPKGIAHDVSLTANWMSKRNQTVPKANYASTEPAIMEDFENGIIAFAYEIGDVQNVPIQQVEEGVDGKGFNLVKGETHTINKTFNQKIDQSEAQSASESIAEATTKSDSWTLSENWNERNSFSQEHSNEVSEEQMEKASQSFSETNKYSISSGKGGSSEHIDENGTSTKTTKKHEFGVSVNVGVKAEIKKVPVIGGKGEASASLGLDYKYTNEKTKEDYEKHTDKTSTYWNTNEGFETSATCSASSEFSHKLGQTVKDTYSYGQVLDFGGSNSNTVSSESTNSNTRGYSSSITYSTEVGSSLTVNETLTADADTGFYRKVIAANFRVFGVVIYDIKNQTFSTMTYSLKINDSEHLFTDYSTVSSFNDYENGVLPFEVPTFVGDYVYLVVGSSEGLRINDETGIIEGYGYKDPATNICYKEYDVLSNTYSNPCDTDVFVPQYIVISRDSTNKEVVKVNGILASAFSGTNITSIHLNESITTILEGSFENCTELKYLTGPNIISIESNAFKNCSDLTEMTVSSIITSLGSGAFDGCEAVTVFAASPEIVDTAMAFEVDSLTVDLNYMNGTIDGKSFAVSSDRDYFCLNGGGRTFNGVTIDTNAGTTELNNIILNSNNGSPLKSSSSTINLGYTRLSSNGFAVNLTEPATITLNGNNYIESTSDNAMLSKSLVLVEKEGSSSIGRIRFTGNALVYGGVMGTQLSVFDSGAHSIIYLTAEEYDRFFNSITLHFDAQGGTVDTEEKDVYFGEAIGELPIPARDYYTFTGWYTVAQSESEDEAYKVTESTIFNSVTDITLYAHWSLNPVSDWVCVSDVPEGAEIVNTKWTYTEKSFLDSRNTSENGWTLASAEWIQSDSNSFNYASFPDGYDPDNWIYTSFHKSCDVSGYETDTSMRSVSTNWAGYVYYKWDYNASYANRTDRSISPYRLNSGTGGYAYWYFPANLSSTDHPYLGTSYCNNYNIPSYNCSSEFNTTALAGPTPRFFRFNYYTCLYIDYYRLFHYYKEDNQESFTQPTESSTVYNIVEWVQYRAK